MLRKMVIVPVLSAGLSAFGQTPAPASDATLFISPHLHPGQTITDITYRVISMSAPEVQEKLFQEPSTGTLTILPSESAATIRWTFDGRADGNGSMKGLAGEYRNQVTQSCHDGKCAANTDASAPFYKQDMWGSPKGELKAGETWTVTLTTAWELGPPATQTITVLSVDKASGIVILKREGEGVGAYAGARESTVIVKSGKSYTVAVKRGAASWAGQAVFQRGLVISDELPCVTSVELSLSEVGLIHAQERQYMSVLQHPALIPF